MSDDKKQGFTPVSPTQAVTGNPHEVSGMDAHGSQAVTSTGQAVTTQPVQSSTIAVWALILGIASLFFILLAVPALVCSIIAMKQTAGNKKSGRGLAIGGLVTSILSTVLTAIMVVIFAVAILVSNRASESVSKDYSPTISEKQSTINGTKNTLLKADTYSLTVTDVVRGYVPASTSYRPAKGNQYVKVTVSIKNTDTTTRYYSAYNFSLRDSKGVEHDYTYVPDELDELSYQATKAGGVVVGSIIFEAPIEIGEQTLVYDPPSYYSSQKAEVSL